MLPLKPLPLKAPPSLPAALSKACCKLVTTLCPPRRGVATTIVRQEGLRGLLRGLSLNYIKVVPSTAIGFTAYDMFKSYLGVSGHL